MEGYILCRARGGFNNALNMLQSAVELAQLQKKTVLVEFPVYSATPLDSIFDFSNFPVPVCIATRSLLETLYEQGKIKTTEPPFYTKEHVLGTIPVHWNAKLQRFAVGNQIPLYNRWKKYPPTTLLIMDGCLAGTNGFHLFKILQLTPTFQRLFLDKRKALPPVYKSLHIRDTDKATKWKEFMPRLQTYSQTDSPIFVCFDTPSVKDHLKTINREFLYSSSWMPPVVRRNLHYQGMQNASILPDAILDLLLLACGSDFLESCPSSGYSQYVRLLRDAPHILKKFIGSESHQ